jgi:phage terminase large subunit
MGLSDEFQILGKQIICKRTGSRFFFMGLRYNINKVKSLGRIDICWIEEADKTSKTTLDKLIPTIRGRSRLEADRGGPFGNGPELWFSYNPDLDTDEIYKRTVSEKDKYLPDYVMIDKIDDSVVLNPDGSIYQPTLGEEYNKNRFEIVRYAIVVKINYWDNKWFPPDLRLEMNVAKAANENRYLEVWEGHTKVVLEGAIYAEEIREVLRERRRGKVPYDPNKPVYVSWDLGHSDKTAMWFVQRVGLEFNLIHYYEDRLKKMPFYIKYLQDKQYNYGTMFLPHDGDDETLSNITPKRQLESVGFKVRVVHRPSKKMIGINAVRTIFPLINFDEVGTADGWQCLQRYAYKVDPDTRAFSKEPEHDTPWSHGADGMQTLALSLKSEQDSKKPKPSNVKDFNQPRANGWMGVM